MRAIRSSESHSSRRAEHGMVPHAQRRHHLDARQVGIPVVCGLGSRLPHARAVDGGFRFRQGAAAPDAAQSLLPSQRTDPGLRVELQRRESAGARLGDVVPLQDGDEPRQGRPALPGAFVPGADAQFQLVGEPQGSRGQERLRRRIPGAGQHRHLRSQRAASDRWIAGAGRRHGMDGVLLLRTCWRWR